jgi:hypothetical protein
MRIQIKDEDNATQEHYNKILHPLQIKCYLKFFHTDLNIIEDNTFTKLTLVCFAS